MHNTIAAKAANIAAPRRVFGIELRTLMALSGAFFAMGSVCHWWKVQRDTRTTEAIIAEYLLVAGLTIFFVALLNKYQPHIAAVKVESCAPDLTVAGLLAASIWILGHWQFGGYDHSSMIQAGWLQLSSLVPFKDYPCTFPPLFFLGDKYALLISGVRWSGFVLLMAIFAVLSFSFLNRQFRVLGFPGTGAITLALAAELATCVVCSFWWHNPITSIVVVMVFVSALVCLAQAEEWKSWALLGISFTLLVLSKPNAWPVGGCVALLYATHIASQRMRALAILMCGLALSAALCWAHRLSPIAILRTYSQIADTRGNPLRMMGLIDLSPVERSITMVWIAVTVILFAVTLFENRDELRRYWREYSCCVLTALTSLAMAGTNDELKTSDLMPLVIVLAVAAFRPWSCRRLSGAGRASAVTVTVFVMVLSAYWGATRMRVRGIGERMFFENVATQTISAGFFQGLHSGPRLVAVLGQLENVFRRYPSDKVFFGPRLEFSYAAFKREPPRGLPIWWHPGSSFPLSDFVAVSQAFENDRFDLLIFLKDDNTRMPVGALQHKLSSYDRVPGFSELDVYVSRKQVSSDLRR